MSAFNYTPSMIILIGACARFSPVCFFPNLIDGGASTSPTASPAGSPALRLSSHWRSDWRTRLLIGWTGCLSLWPGCFLCFVVLKLKFCPWRWTVSVSMGNDRVCFVIVFWGVYLIVCLFSLLLRKPCFFLHIFCKNKSVCLPVFIQTSRETEDTFFFFHGLIISN